mgnify:CR=1 FL=1
MISQFPTLLNLAPLLFDKIQTILLEQMEYMYSLYINRQLMKKWRLRVVI